MAQTLNLVSKIKAVNEVSPSRVVYQDIARFGQKQYVYAKSPIKQAAFLRASITGFNSLSRLERYIDYDLMDAHPLASNVLDIMADDIVTQDIAGKILQIYSDDEDVVEILEDLFYNRLDVDYNLGFWARNAIKYGNCYVVLERKEGDGIQSSMSLPVNAVERKEEYNEERGFFSTFSFYAEKFDSSQILDFRIIGDEKFLPQGRCLKWDTYIETPNGFKFIKDIAIGDEVFSFDLKTHQKIKSKILNTVCSGQKNIIEIKTKHAGLELSEEHKVMVVENGNFVYKNVFDLHLGDLLVIDNLKDKGIPHKINKNFDGEINWNNWTGASNKTVFKNIKNHNVPDVVDEEFAQFFGFMIGDGWIHNNRVHFAIGEHEELNEYYSNLMQKFSGKEPKIGYIEGKPSEKMVTSKYLKMILEINGFIGKAKTKRLPKWIFTAEKNIKDAFIRGLIDANGWVTVDKWNCESYHIELSNKYLIKDIKMLLQSMSKKCGNIYHRKRYSEKLLAKSKSVESWRIEFYNSDIKQADKYDIEDRKSNVFVVEPITSIKNTETKDFVYDIYVDNDNHNFYANGVIVHNSVLDPVRRTWKLLRMMEDSSMIYRIARSPERMHVQVEVGNMKPAQVEQYLSTVKTNMQDISLINQDTGDIDLRYGPASILENYYSPMRGGVEMHKINLIKGGENANSIDDINFILNEFLAGVKVPKAYLGYEESLTRNNLSTEDIRYSKTIQRYQKMILSELYKAAYIHLLDLGIDDEKILNFELSLNNPSQISEMQKLEVMKTKVETAKELADFFSREFIYKEIFGMSDKEIRLEINRMIKEAKVNTALEMLKSVAVTGTLDSAVSEILKYKFDTNELGSEKDDEVKRKKKFKVSKYSKSDDAISKDVGKFSDLMKKDLKADKKILFGENTNKLAVLESLRFKIKEKLTEMKSEEKIDVEIIEDEQ